MNNTTSQHSPETRSPLRATACNLMPSPLTLAPLPRDPRLLGMRLPAVARHAEPLDRDRDHDRDHDPSPPAVPLPLQPPPPPPRRLLPLPRPPVQEVERFERLLGVMLVQLR